MAGLLARLWALLVLWTDPTHPLWVRKRPAPKAPQLPQEGPYRTPGERAPEPPCSDNLGKGLCDFYCEREPGHSGSCWAYPQGGCRLPGPGWLCTLEDDHNGPCEVVRESDVKGPRDLDEFR